MSNSKSAPYGDGNFSSPRSTRNGLLYLLIGGGIGATVALLFAPKSGPELRTDISEITKKKYGETLDMANNLKQRTADFYQTAKEKTDYAYEFAANKLSRTNDRLEDAAESVADHVNGEILEIDSGTQKHSGTGRRSSNIV